jgi:hypothetical protein
MMHRNSRLAVIVISALLLWVLGNPIQPVLGDLSNNQIQKEKQVAEEKAKEYLKQFAVEERADPTKPNYGQFHVTATKSSDRDIKTEIKNAQLVSETKAKAFLKQMWALKTNNISKPNYGQFNTTSTPGTTKDKKADLEKAKQTSEEMAMQLIAKMYPKLTQKNYGG